MAMFNSYITNYQRLSQFIVINLVFFFPAYQNTSAAAGTRFAHQRQEIHFGGTPQRRSAGPGAVVQRELWERSTSRLQKS